MINKRDFLRLISDGNFKELFITELGWNRYRAQSQLPAITVDDTQYDITAIAERNGFQVLTCTVGELPGNSTCRKIDTKLRRQANDYICIYRLQGTQHDLWVVPVKNNEKRDLTFVEYETAEKADLLYSKIDGFSFELGEETNIVDLRAKIHKAFIVNNDKITKDFYTGFRKQHKAFATLITGIDDNIDIKNNRKKQWYTSVMLNRLMFCYFIQKKGFLNGDFDYLRHKLEWVRREQGEDRFFHSFYKGFLIHLFHDGLNAPRHTREWEITYGKIPYLNGGMFDEHELEHEYGDIDIADEAFEQLFAFFDSWRWHLDTRITASGKDINPDVLGYIFEQYINDRAAMGAYYTKEDITEYIGKNCILPFLMDRLKETDAKAFAPAGEVWTMLRGSGDRYIYDAVKRGYTHDWQRQIPENIARGIAPTQPGLLERRSDWNTPTPEQWALPTEIWRETIERLQRCESLLKKINGGEITEINDFITLNLDIRSFVYDLLATTADSKLVLHFYHALQQVTILDPTCGSGAFLFAAMNILEPLYEVCIERMQVWNEQNPALFKKELDEISNKYRSNIQYFIFKSIILRNLYGVDLMVEATEIAKLRLFLKMVAVVEVDRRADNMGLDPLPDIDFNIRSGNTLVGYATEEQLNADLSFAKDIMEQLANQEFKTKIDDEMHKVATTFDIFKELQLTQDADLAAFKQAKSELRTRLEVLNDLLNKRLFSATGTGDYDKWLASHQPFHWLAEFYQIMHDNGGFDVIIGNPPYVTFTPKSLLYRVSDYKTLGTGNLFALIGERCNIICGHLSRIGYIIPLSGLSIKGFESFQNIIYSNRTSWNSFYSGDRNPSELFTGVKIRAAIYLSVVSMDSQKFVTKYIKYYSSERDILFSKVFYVESDNSISAPKLHGKIGKEIITKIKSISKRLESEFNNEDVFYYHAAPIYWGKALNDLQPLTSRNLNVADSYKPRSISKLYRDFAFDLVHSTLFFYYWIVFSDCYNLTKNYFSDFNVPIISSNDLYSELARQLNQSMIANMKIAEYTYKNRGVVRFAQFFPKLSKPIIDEIDKVLAKHYGFTEEELDFIINYDIKYRMGDELNND